MAGARLRPMRWDDIGRLVELEREAFADDAWGEATWWSELAGRPRREYVVAQGDGADGEGGDVVGYFGIAHGGDVADVMTIAVAPAARGTGLGRALLDDLVARAAARGAQHLLLEVRADNEPARKLYERNDFQTISVRRRYYQPGDVDAIIMRRALPAPPGPQAPTTTPTEGETR